jgi:hypothetical protein
METLMTTISPTVVHDEQLAAARTASDGFQSDVQAARDHRQRVRDHRLRTVGRSAAERLELPAVDLANLRTRYLDALQAEQDAGLKSHDARQRLEQLERARPTVEAGETGTHLAALLQHRSAWAGRVDAALDSLMLTIQTYLVTARESDSMTAALGIREDWILDATGPLVDRVLFCLKTVAPTQFAQFSAGPLRPPLAEADRELTKRARTRVEHAATPSASSGSGGA